MSLLDAPAISRSDIGALRSAQGFPFPLTPCATRLIFPNNGLYSATTPTITYRSSHVILRAGNMVRIGWVNQSFNGTAANAFTLNASLQIAPTQSTALATLAKYTLRFSGSTTVVVPVGGFALSDPLFINFEAGQVFFVRTCVVSAAASNNWPIGLRVDRFQEGFFTGDGTTTDSAFTTGATQAFTPAMIGCPSRDGKWVCVTGDSILVGSNDPTLDVGFFDRWQRASNLPGTRLAVGGETVASGGARFGLRWQMAAGASHALCEGGGNDISGGASLATVQASLIAHWRDLWLLGMKVSQLTILPRPSSSDNWITATNQTPWTAETTRVALNAWLRAGAPVTASGSTYVAAAIGADGSFACPYLQRTVDWCQSCEVNASNVLTQDGGRLIVGASLRSATATGGSTTTIVDSAANFSALAKPVAGCLVRITAGQGSGQTNWIIGAPSNTQINLLNTFGMAVNSTSVYEIIDTPTRDNIHPSGTLHQTLAEWLGANFVL